MKVKACTKCWASYTAEQWIELEPTTNPEGCAPGAESRICAHCSEVLTIDRTFLESHLRNDGPDLVVPTDATLDRARTAAELLRALLDAADAFLGPKR